jgi:hypothetical protein
MGSLPRQPCEGRELLRVREQAPDRLARGHDRRRERLVVVLEQREHLHHHQLVGPTEIGQGDLRLALVERAELVQEIVDLVLERDLGEEADGLAARTQLCLEMPRVPVPTSATDRQA